jgi:cbb3-type cytochrome oxidase maturation protein
MIANLKTPRGQSPTGERASPPVGRGIHRFVWAFGLVMIVIAGGGFLFKLIEFITVFTTDEPFQFAIIPVVTYLLVAAGFGCLFFWAYLSGQFKDVEAPKYRMLQMQDEIDREEG